jgi:hypothetical protein
MKIITAEKLSSLTINEPTHAPNLKTVTGDLYIYSDAKLDSLESVGGYLSIYSDAKLDAPSLESVGGYLSINSDAKLDAPSLESVGGDLSIYPDAKLDAPSLESVGGYLSIYSDIELNLAKRLWKHNYRHKWYFSDKAPEWLLQRKKGDITYRIDGVNFDKDLFDKIRNDNLSAKEVFAITNMEQRRIAYERMDKRKMDELGGETLESNAIDKYGNPMSLITFKVDGLEKPFRFLRCVCPSTSREYFLETQKRTCQAAKMASFGLSEAEQFDAEY